MGQYRIHIPRVRGILDIPRLADAIDKAFSYIEKVTEIEQWRESNQFTTAGYQNSWVDNGTSPLQLYKDPWNRVHFEGRIDKAGPITTPELLFTMREGYRPKREILVLAYPVVNLSIGTNGDVTYLGTVLYGGSLGFTNVEYYAD